MCGGGWVYGVWTYNIMCVSVCRSVYVEMWKVCLCVVCVHDCNYFSHHSLTQLYRKQWMFQLVGTETFKIGKKLAEVVITANGLSFEYTLNIDGKSLKKFVEAQAKNTRVWLPVISGEKHRVVLGKIWLLS